MSDKNSCSEISILGGTYVEICFEPELNFIGGSGFRAVRLLKNINKNLVITFFTACSSIERQSVEMWQKQNKGINLKITDISNTIAFKYDHPLREPMIYPRIDCFFSNKPIIEISDEKVIIFGMIEADVKAKAKDVVYDPQSPINPICFSQTNSTAERLVMVVNSTEAKKMSGEKEFENIKKFFFDKEHCYALIIKQGAKGAIVYMGKEDNGTNIPVYKTRRVWPIGSGDIFTTYFAYKWFTSGDIIKSAQMASKAAAIYCDSMGMDYLTEELDTFEFQALSCCKYDAPQKVYLAGPFFTFAQRWLINEAFHSLKDIGLDVFSPYHDVGLGNASAVVDKDIEGLDESGVIFAIIDGLDSGTLFEVGYAIAKKKKVVAFVQNETEGALKMLEGTHCDIEKDFATAIYKTYWYATE